MSETDYTSYATHSQFGNLSVLDIAARIREAMDSTSKTPAEPEVVVMTEEQFRGLMRSDIVSAVQTGGPDPLLGVRVEHFPSLEEAWLRCMELTCIGVRAALYAPEMESGDTKEAKA